MTPLGPRGYNNPYQQAVLDQVHPTWRAEHPRIFKESFESHEHSAITYILENLSKKSMLGLLPIKGKLRERGNDLEHVHPLAFFMEIMSHHELKKHFHRLRNKDNKAWTEFSKGAIKSFKEEKQKQNIHDHHIELFCQRTQKDPNHVRFLMHQEKWHDFLAYL